MTVKTLKELLSQYPEDLRVVVDGYEDGYDDVARQRISVSKIQLNTKSADWEGRHGDIDTYNRKKDDNHQIVDALVFHRESY